MHTIMTKQINHALQRETPKPWDNSLTKPMKQ